MTTHSSRTILLATDQQRSLVNTLGADVPHPVAYSPYGHRPAHNPLLSWLGFNGEMPDAVTGHYHLGNGYRQFNPVLMRFNKPDSWSPFGKGGLNAYAYCAGDPINRVDPNGHAFGITQMLRKLNIKKTPKKPLETRVPKEIEKYITKDSPFDDQYRDQFTDDFTKGLPPPTKIKELEENFWTRELTNDKSIVDKYEIIANEKERFYKKFPYRVTHGVTEPVNFNRKEFLKKSRTPDQLAVNTSTIRKA